MGFERFEARRKGATVGGIAAWLPMSISEGVALGLPPPEAVRGTKKLRSGYAGLLLCQLTLCVLCL